MPGLLLARRRRCDGDDRAGNRLAVHARYPAGDPGNSQGHIDDRIRLVGDLDRGGRTSAADHASFGVDDDVVGSCGVESDLVAAVGVGSCLSDIRGCVVAASGRKKHHRVGDGLTAFEDATRHADLGRLVEVVNRRFALAHQDLLHAGDEHQGTTPGRSADDHVLARGDFLERVAPVHSGGDGLRPSSHRDPREQHGCVRDGHLLGVAHEPCDGAAARELDHEIVGVRVGADFDPARIERVIRLTDIDRVGARLEPGDLESSVERRDCDACRSVSTERGHEPLWPRDGNRRPGDRSAVLGRDDAAAQDAAVLKDERAGVDDLVGTHRKTALARRRLAVGGGDDGHDARLDAVDAEVSRRVGEDLILLRPTVDDDAHPRTLLLLLRLGARAHAKRRRNGPARQLDPSDDAPGLLEREVDRVVAGRRALAVRAGVPDGPHRQISNRLLAESRKPVAAVRARMRFAREPHLALHGEAGDDGALDRLTAGVGDAAGDALRFPHAQRAEIGRLAAPELHGLSRHVGEIRRLKRHVVRSGIDRFDEEFSVALGHNSVALDVVRAEPEPPAATAPLGLKAHVDVLDRKVLRRQQAEHEDRAGLELQFDVAPVGPRLDGNRAVLPRGEPVLRGAEGVLVPCEDAVEREHPVGAGPLAGTFVAHHREEAAVRGGRADDRVGERLAIGADDPPGDPATRLHVQGVGVGVALLSRREGLGDRPIQAPPRLARRHGLDDHDPGSAVGQPKRPIVGAGCGVRRVATESRRVPLERRDRRVGDRLLRGQVEHAPDNHRARLQSQVEGRPGGHVHRRSRGEPRRFHAHGDRPRAHPVQLERSGSVRLREDRFRHVGTCRPAQGRFRSRRHGDRAHGRTAQRLSARGGDLAGDRLGGRGRRRRRGGRRGLFL